MDKGETLAEAGVELVELDGAAPNRRLIVFDSETRRYEEWFEKPDAVSAHLLHAGSRFEFARSWSD